jgi:hypothetical protein
MTRTEFVVSWEKFTRYSVRHYARYFEHLKDAQEKARKVAADPLVTYCVIHQQEDSSTPDCAKVRIVSWNIAY